MKLRRRRPTPPTDVLDPFPGDPITQRIVLTHWLRVWADDLERTGRKVTPTDDRHAVFLAGAVSALRATADEMTRGAFDPTGPAWTDPATHPWTYPTETRSQ